MNIANSFNQVISLSGLCFYKVKIGHLAQYPRVYSSMCVRAYLRVSAAVMTIVVHDNDANDIIITFIIR